MVDELARRIGLTARQIRYWRSKGYVPAVRKEGRAWVYDVVSVRRLLLIATLLKAGATPQSVLASMRGLEANAQNWLSTDFWRLKLYVVGSAIFASNGKILVNPVTGELAMPILVRNLHAEARIAALDTGSSARPVATHQIAVRTRGGAARQREAH
jgi:DNA-binding transcriptional MerR regulator